MTAAYNVVGSVVAVVAANSPGEAEATLDEALRGHGFDTLREANVTPATFESEPDSPAHPLPAPCGPGVASWADFVDEVRAWNLAPHEALHLIRLAASAVDSGVLSATTEGFSDPDEVDNVAVRTWRAIAYLGAQP